MERRKKEWKVYFQGKRPKGTRKGTEIPVHKSIAWGDEIWHIPAVYSCSQGLVIDLCVEVQPERVRQFIEKWQLLEPGRDRISNFTIDERMQLELENPMEIHAGFRAKVNGKELREKQSSSRAWIPFQPPELQEDARTEAYMEHYGCDPGKAWVFRRVSMPWVTKNKPKINRLELFLEAKDTAIPGPCLSTLKVGEPVEFFHPVTDSRHTLTVESLTPEEFSQEAFHDETLDYPGHFLSVVYTVEPELQNGTVSLRDICSGDRPRRKPQIPQDPCLPEAVHDAAAIGIIGGADGPSVLMVNKNASRHCDCSSLYFEPVKDLSWRMVFRCKLRDSVQISLIP